MFLSGPWLVIRADEKNSSVSIGDNCNVQDGVIIHALGGTDVRIGCRSSLSHGVLVHGPCAIGNRCFIGFRTVVFRATVADGVYVGAAAVVQNVTLPADRKVSAQCLVNREGFISGLKKCGPEDISFAKQVVNANLDLVRLYRQGEIK